MLTDGVPFVLLKEVRLRSRSIWVIRPGRVSVMVRKVGSFCIWTPRNAETSPLSLSLNVLDRAWMTSLIAESD